MLSACLNIILEFFKKANIESYFESQVQCIAPQRPILYFFRLNTTHFPNKYDRNL